MLEQSYKHGYPSPQARTVICDLCMSVTLSPTPSLIEERKEKKRRILSWIMAQARATRSGSFTGAKSASPLPPSSPPIQYSKKISIPKGNDKTMNQPYLTQPYAAQPIPTTPTVLIPGQNYSSSSSSTLYNAYPGPTPYTYRPQQHMPSASTDTYLNRAAVPMPSPSPVGATALEEEAIAEATDNAAVDSVAPVASAVPQATGTGQAPIVSITTQPAPGQAAAQPSINVSTVPRQMNETCPPIAPSQAPAALSATSREPIQVPTEAPARYTTTSAVPAKVPTSMGANEANTLGVPAATTNPQPMTIVNVIPNQTSSPPVPAPQPEPISSQPFVSRDYAYPANPLPAVASRSPEPVGRSRPMHREEVFTSRSHASRGVSRSPASEYNSPIPPDYVPVSQGSASRSRHAHTRPRAITPPMADHPRGIHTNTSPPLVTYHEAPREAHYYSTSPRHSDSHRHGHGHSDSRHRHNHGHNHEHGHRHSSRHRSSSQPAHDHHHHHHHHRHHHRHHRDPQHSSFSRPTYARERSYSLDAGDHRMRSSRALAYPGHAPYGYGSGYNGNAAHPQMMPQPHSPVYPSYTRSQPAPIVPTAAGGVGATGTTAGSAGQYRISVQPPTSASHQPVGTPVADGRGGYSVVPHVGQNVHVLQKPSRSMPGGSGGTVPGAPAIDSRGRQSSPGFWGSLFGRKGRSSSAVPVQGNSYSQQNPQYGGYLSLQPVQYYQANNRPRHSRRRSSYY